MTLREVVYMVLDEIKGKSDDFNFNEEHVMFLLSKYRVFLLKQRYSDIRKQIPDSNYQTICLNLQEVPAIPGNCCAGKYLRSTEKIPFLMNVGIHKVFPIDYFNGEITLVNRDRMKYVGYNRFLKNIIYCCIGPDNYLYFKSNNSSYKFLSKVKFTGIFQDSLKASKLECTENNSEICDIIDREFPIEEALVPPMIELVVKDLLGAAYRPEDTTNNAQDDLAKIPVKNGKK